MAKRQAAATQPATTGATFEGMTYNAAVRLQATVRDVIGAPVSLMEALEIAREQFGSLTGEKQINALRKRVADAAKAKEDERVRREREVSLNAGTR